MKRLILNLSLCIFTCRHLFASFSLFTQENLNNQLSNNAILCMHQDPYGFMWFGTYDGLNLYNGKETTTFRFELGNPHSLSGNSIHNIAFAGNSHLWIATQFGLNRFSLTERKVVETYPEYRTVNMIASNENENSWLFTKDYYISYYDAHEKKIYDFPSKSVNHANLKSLFLNRNMQLCLILRDGYLQYVTLATTTHAISIKEKKIHDRMIDQVFYEDNMICFIDEDQNLFIYDDSKQQKILLRNVSKIIKQYGLISSLCFFQNNVFISFMHSGLVKFSMSNHQTAPELVDMSIGVFGLLKDRYQESIWIGTDGQGVKLYYSEKDKFGNILLDNLSLSAKRPIRSLYTDDENTLWIGTKGDGIIRIKNYDQFNNSQIPIANIQHFTTCDEGHDNPVYYFERSKYNKNDLWISTNGNISYYSYKDKKIYVLEESSANAQLLTHIHTFCEINDSTLWVSSEGLYKIIIDKNKKPYTIKSKKKYIFQKNGVNLEDNFYSMIFDGDSSIILGSRNGYGTIRFNIHSENYHFISMNNAENKGLGDAICLYMHKDSILYIGASSGLTQVKMRNGKENEIKQFNRNHGIINDMVHGIEEDNAGIIWLSTNKGLVKYNPQNDSFLNVKSSRIGVVEYSDNASWRCPISGRLFFGGVNGLVWIEPQREKEQQSYTPNLFFTDLICQGKRQTLYEYNEGQTKKLKLSSKQNTFQLSFAVIDYINSDNYDYYYLLENYNAQWVSLQKENRINFTNLPYGNYTLKVKYKNDVLQSDNKIYSLRIIVSPPWYLSSIAYVAYCAITLIITSSVVYYIRCKIRRKQNLIAQKIMDEQKEKLYESKLRFFTNITHELYTPLTLINGALEQMKKEEGNSRIKKYTAILQNNIINLNELIQEILDYRKIEESEINRHTLKNIFVTNVLDNLLISFSEVVQQNNIRLVASIPDNLYWNTDRASFKKIVYNLVSNALKYTSMGGEIKLNVSIENDFLKIVVRNTGKGISPDKIQTLFNRYNILENTEINANNQMTARHGLGLFICHSMTKLLQGEIAVESIENEYIQFTVTLPDLFGQPELEIKKEKNTAINPSPASLLVVDDNAEIVEMIEDILSPYYTILKAFSAQEALLILKEQTPLLIITDIMMPVIDGLSFIAMIREDKYIKRLPIIALSAKVDEKDQAKGYDAGVDAYITKPFSSALLVSVVQRFLANKEEMKSYYDSAESAFEYIDGKLMHQKDKEFIDAVLSIIKENLSCPDLGPEFIADKMKISSRNLCRQLKKILSITPSDFIKNYKLSYAAKLLLSTNLSVKEIICKIGIGNKSYFYKEFFRRYNVSPKQFQKMEQKKD